MDTSKIFDGYAKDYTAGRPDYAMELIECMCGKHGISKDSVIADIGSGTGKFARHLIERGSEVFCVEPNEDMRQTAERELSEFPNFHSVKGDAEMSGLPDQSVDFIARSLSGSYSLQSEDKDFDEYMSEIKGVFEKNCVNGMALIANQSVAYFGAP